MRPEQTAKVAGYMIAVLVIIAGAAAVMKS
jgi:hypothetical protein